MGPRTGGGGHKGVRGGRQEEEEDTEANLDTHPEDRGEGETEGIAEYIGEETEGDAEG